MLGTHTRLQRGPNLATRTRRRPLCVLYVQDLNIRSQGQTSLTIILAVESIFRSSLGPFRVSVQWGTSGFLVENATVNLVCLSNQRPSGPRSWPGGTQWRNFIFQKENNHKNIEEIKKHDAVGKLRTFLCAYSTKLIRNQGKVHSFPRPQPSGT